MKPVISDPDTKINMSLDEIIRLTRGEINNKFRRGRTKKRKGRLLKKDDSDHSVPLLTSSEGVSVYVSKKSPLLNPDIRQSFLKAVTNRALNAELLKNSTRIIPAKYELIKTDKGVERVLVPVKNYICKPLRKLHRQRNNFEHSKILDDEIPPLLSAPITKPLSLPYDAFKQKLESKMEVDDVYEMNNDDGDDDVVVLGTKKKKPELIDVEMNLPVSVLEKKQSQSITVKTLNDRFTRLTGSFQF